MGNITRFIIRFGVTGNTARWVARHYLRLKTEVKSNVDVMRELIEFRYKTFSPGRAKTKMVERLSYLDNLTDLTFSILQTEGAIKTKEMPMYLQMEITTVIMDELRKKGVPEKDIHGESITSQEIFMEKKKKVFTVYVDDIYHLYESEYRTTLGEYHTYEEAETACKKLIDDFIRSYGSSKKDLAIAHMHYGEDPWISPEPEGKHFSGSKYYNEAYDRHFNG